MDERQVTIDMDTVPLPRPFMVLATQNPVELEGTFPLPEAQLDRFLIKLAIGYPSEEDERAIMRRFKEASPLTDLQPVTSPDEIVASQRLVRRVHVSPVVEGYILALVRATRLHDSIELGASPRATLALYRTSQALAAAHGRGYVLPDDVKAMAPSTLAHRLMLSTRTRLRGRDNNAILGEILSSVPVPVETLGIESGDNMQSDPSDKSQMDAMTDLLLAGKLPQARIVAESIVDVDYREWMLNDLVKNMIGAGARHSATSIARFMANSYYKADALRSVAKYQATRGDLQAALAVLEDANKVPLEAQLPGALEPDIAPDRAAALYDLSKLFSKAGDLEHADTLKAEAIKVVERRGARVFAGSSARRHPADRCARPENPGARLSCRQRELDGLSQIYLTAHADFESSRYGARRRAS